MAEPLRVIEIPREAWVERLNEFTRAHEGWLVSLDVVGPDIGAHPEVDNLPLIGVSADRIDHDGTVAISVARSTIAHFTHLIHDARHVYLERTHNRAAATLLVESADGTRTVLQVRAPALQRSAGCTTPNRRRNDVGAH